MHADEAVGTAGLRGKLRDRNRRCVAGEDGAGLERAVGFLQDAEFQVELLGDGFHDEIGGGERGDIGNRLDAREDHRNIGFVQLAFFDFPIEILGDGLEPAIEVALVNVAENHMVAVAREDVRDSVAHRAGAEHAYRLHFFSCHGLPGSWCRGAIRSARRRVRRRYRRQGTGRRCRASSCGAAIRKAA